MAFVIRLGLQCSLCIDSENIFSYKLHSLKLNTSSAMSKLRTWTCSRWMQSARCFVVIWHRAIYIVAFSNVSMCYDWMGVVRPRCCRLPVHWNTNSRTNDHRVHPPFRFPKCRFLHFLFLPFFQIAFAVYFCGGSVFSALFCFVRIGEANALHRWTWTEGRKPLSLSLFLSVAVSRLNVCWPSKINSISPKPDECMSSLGLSQCVVSPLSLRFSLRAGVSVSFSKSVCPLRFDCVCPWHLISTSLFAFPLAIGACVRTYVFRIFFLLYTVSYAVSCLFVYFYLWPFFNLLFLHCPLAIWYRVILSLLSGLFKVSKIHLLYLSLRV